MNSDPVHRAKHHQLWIDKVRTDLDQWSPPADIELCLKIDTLILLRGGTSAALDLVRTISPQRLRNELVTNDLTDHLHDAALRAIRAHGYPQRELTETDMPACSAKLHGAVNWCTYEILRCPQTQVMLLDDRTARAVADSSNDQITAAELQHLPHNPCLIEFYRPIEIVGDIKHGVRVRAVGFKSLGDAAAPAAVVCFYLDYWQPAPQSGARLPTSLGFWYGGCTCATMDNAARIQMGLGSDPVLEQRISDECKRVARNLWDFVTSRSINYDRIKRKPARHLPDRELPQHTQGLRSQLDREVFHLYLTREMSRAEGEHSRQLPPPWGYRVEVLGKFHHLVYCGKCGDLHRHDLLGTPCRKCGEIVGPRANVRIEKSWHHPYFVGPEGAPVKEVVRDVHRRKVRR